MLTKEAVAQTGVGCLGIGVGLIALYVTAGGIMASAETLRLVIAAGSFVALAIGIISLVMAGKMNPRPIR